MQQRKLKLEQLEVESFEVLPEAPKGRGTVQGREFARTRFGGDTCAGTCYDYDTCGISCPGGSCYPTCETCEETCRGQDTCDPSCMGTCDETCETCLCTDEFEICGFTG